MIKFEHTTTPFRFARKALRAARKDVLEGLSPEGIQMLTELGAKGWELVAVVPYSAGGTMLPSGTDAALGFFKRVIPA